MNSIELSLVMAAAVVAGGYLLRVLPFAVPLPLVHIALGAAIALTSSHRVLLDPDVFFLLFLPPLLFLSGWRIPKTGPLRDKALILELALGLVIFTVIGAGFLIHRLIPAMPTGVAFALAAIVSPTDPVALASITARLPLPKRLTHILQGEALLNDASGLVCFRFAVTAALTGTFSPAAALLSFLWLAAAGVAIGVGVTLGISLGQRWLTRRESEESGSAPILLNLLTPYAAYLLAEYAHASGILAAVAAGITMSQVELTGRAPATTRVQRAAIWDMVEFALNGLVFVLLGEQLPWILREAALSVGESGHRDPAWLAAYALAVTLGLVLLRFVWVWTSLRLTLFARRQHGVPLSLRLVATVSLAGVRGALTLAGALTLPLAMPDGARLPSRDLAIFLAAAVILLSLLLSSALLPRVGRSLALPAEPADQQGEDRARRDAARAAIEAVEAAGSGLKPGSAEFEIYTYAAAHVLALYRRRLDDGAPGAGGPASPAAAERQERVLRLAALQAERDKVFAMARGRELSDESARKLVREIDLVEARYR